MNKSIALILIHTITTWCLTPQEMQYLIQPQNCPSSIVQPLKIKRPLKFLHIGFHQGCILEIEHVARTFGLDLTSWFIFDRPLEHFEGINADLCVYNITHERAERVWEKHKDYFNRFDVIITSDTAPLSRIFLQNNHWKKPLIIWVCNRFDFFYSPTHTPLDFPDVAYYDLFKRATQQSNVFIVSYTPYEWYHALKQGINIGLRTIKPIGVIEEHQRYAHSKWSVPQEIDKSQTIFIYPRLDDAQLAYIKQACDAQGITTYSGSYNGTADIADFKGIIYWPYQWSNLCLFENFQRGLVHFVPSIKFLQTLKEAGAPLHSIMHAMLDDRSFEFNEWYTKEHAPYIVYYDSWQDLKHKIDTTDYATMRTKITAFAQRHTENSLLEWKELFHDLQIYSCK